MSLDLNRMLTVGLDSLVNTVFEGILLINYGRKKWTCQIWEVSLVFLYPLHVTEAN